MEPFLAFDGVWKSFRRGAVHDSLRDLLPAMIRRITRQQQPELGERDFWALKDLTFEVRPGDVLGIIGSNGAGKSTTLKILNHLMEPTKGEVLTHGKICSLIEVSAGFHQDLTGRQNVFLQGAIMGMKKTEITRKFDQIVEFSGISDFIDTPVKRYSSGMNARLGFAIAAHLEPDVLIIDEVLSVGDHSFQQRAFGKIKSIAKSGVPIVLVSHQLDRILELCTETILLNRGEVETSGSPMHCINAYLHPEQGQLPTQTSVDCGIRFDTMESLSGFGVQSGREFTIRVNGESTKASYPHSWQMAFRVINSESGTHVHSVLGEHRGITMPAPGMFDYQLELQMNLPAGSYLVEVVVWDMDVNMEVVRGPRVKVDVLEHNKFFGTVQLNSRWTSLASREPDASA